MPATLQRPFQLLPCHHARPHRKSISCFRPHHNASLPNCSSSSSQCEQVQGYVVLGLQKLQCNLGLQVGTTTFLMTPLKERRQYRRLEQELGIVKLMLAISPSAESNEVLRRGGFMEKCSKVSRWNFFKQKKYSRRLKELDEEIDRFLRMQTLRELQELKSMMSGAGGHRPNMGVGQRRGLRPMDSRLVISGRQCRVKRRPCIAIARAQHRQTCGKRRERRALEQRACKGTCAITLPFHVLLLSLLL
ncbi:hypothetical protein EJ110_NYTH46099 [Nymphaea thermarum]|nr:hypothetical protein EJ110_NYTH46099 [Nymphaea thermarum]